MQIRDIVKEDFDIFHRMSYDFYQSDAAVGGSTHDNFEKTFQELLSDSPLLRGIMLLDDEANIIGYSLLGFYWSSETQRIMIIIDELYIQSQHRGKQYGSKFFSWLAQTYDKERYSYRLDVNPANPRAKKLYESLGFEDGPYITMIKF